MVQVEACTMRKPLKDTGSEEHEWRDDEKGHSQAEVHPYACSQPVARGLIESLRGTRGISRVRDRNGDKGSQPVHPGLVIIRMSMFGLVQSVCPPQIGVVARHPTLNTEETMRRPGIFSRPCGTR
jgi:hypothetical protein